MSDPVIIRFPDPPIRVAKAIDGERQPRSMLASSIALASFHLEHASEHLAQGNTQALVLSMRHVAACTEAALSILPAALGQVRGEGQP